MKYKAIGFDWGGVIYGEPGPVFSKEAAQLLEVSHEEFKKIYFKHNKLINIENIPMEIFWKKILSELNKEDKYPQMIDYVNHRPKETLNLAIVELIKKLKLKGYKLGVLSNNILKGAIKIRQSEVAKYLDVILVSEEIGYMKPQKEAYQFFADRLKVKPQELIFIDDTEKSIISSKEVGYRSLLFTNYKKLLKDLSFLGISI